MLQKTLVVLKPDAVRRGLSGEIITRFEKVGLKLVATKMVSPDKDFFYHHYETIGALVSRRGQKTFEIVLDMMTSGPVIAMVWEGVEAVEIVRKMAGDTQPKTANPGTIRGDYTHMSYTYADDKGIGIPNVIHASGNPEEAIKEVAHWFKPEEIYAYKRFDESVILGD